MSINERNDVRWVLVSAPFEGDSGVGYMVGHDGVTEIRIVARHGPMDWIPYIEAWQGDHLYAEAAQHQCVVVEFARPKAPPPTAPDAGMDQPAATSEHRKDSQ